MINWTEKDVAGNKVYEGRTPTGSFLFDIDETRIGVWLIDLKDVPPTYYRFPNVNAAKTMAEESLNDKSVLTPFLDKEWQRMSDKGSKIILEAEKLLKDEDIL